VAHDREAGDVLRGTVILAGVCSLALASSAGAADYEAQFVDQSRWSSMEQGDEVDQFFRLKNTGTAVWNRGGPNPVRLGVTSNGGNSAFYLPSDWFTSSRATLLDVPAVDPGTETDFRFRIKAPAAVGMHQEHFQLLAENLVWFGPDMYLEWTVLPAQSPQVRLTSAPVRVVAGAPLDLAAEATDNLAVERMTFSIGGRTAEATRADEDSSTWTARLETADLAVGTHTLAAKAFDRGGREAVSTSDVQLVAPEPPAVVTPPPGLTPPVVPPVRRRLDSTTGIRARTAGRTRVRVDLLKVEAPMGSRITVRCRPRRCRPITVRKTRRPHTRIRFRTRRALPVGTRILVRVTRRGMVGEETRFTVARGDVTKRERPLS
jgi:hypothetical protein